MFPNQTMNQNQMMNPNQNFNQNQVNESDGIYVTFRDSGAYENKKPITIKCRINEKVSDLIEKYRVESGDRDETKKFIYNAKVLHSSLTLSQAGIMNGSNIFVVITKGVKGG